MKILRLLTAAILLPVWLGAFSVDELHEGVKEFFARSLSVDQDALRVTMKHIPDDLHHYGDAEVNIYSQKRKPDLGHQSVWVKLLQNGRLLKKFPVSVHVGLEKEVLIAARKIPYGKKITASMLASEKRLLDDDLGSYFSTTSEVADKESKLTIKPGTTLQRRMLKTIPDVHRGQQVTVEIRSGALAVRTRGKAKSDGYKGDKVRVVLSETRQVVRGEVVAKNKIVLTQE